jgi:hypothetical protein
MADIFGYNSNVKSTGQIASADFASITVGGTKSNGEGGALVQSLNITYQQRLEEIMQVGSPQIHWLPGRPSGNLEISKLVGSGGFFKDWKGKCGIITPVSVSVSGGECGFSGSGSLRVDLAVVERVSMQVSSDKQTIASSAAVRIAGLTET